MISVTDNCKLAKAAVPYLSALSTADKNNMLRIASDALTEQAEYILSQNKIDLDNNGDKPKHKLFRTFVRQILHKLNKVAFVSVTI